MNVQQTPNNGESKVLKQRLIGAAVIIALLVIFVPMILDGSKGDDPVSTSIDIPEKEEFEIPSRLELPVESDLTADANTTIEIPPATDSSSTEQSQTITIENDSIPVAVTEPVVETATAVTEAVAPVVETPVAAPTEIVIEQTPPAAPTPPPVAVADPVPAPAKSGFVVQAGSFSKQQNAQTLTDKLQASGYPAFVEASQVGNKSAFRVKVGPYAQRTEANELHEKLKQKEKINGLVVSHPK